MLKLARYEKKPGFKSAFSFTFPKTIFDSFQHYLIRRIPFSFCCSFVFIVITFLFARIHPNDFPQTPVWLITQLRSTNSWQARPLFVVHVKRVLQIRSVMSSVSFAWCLVKMSFICMRINNHFHINGFALCLALKQRLGATRKGPIGLISKQKLCTCMRLAVGNISFTHFMTTTWNSSCNVFFPFFVIWSWKRFLRSQFQDTL